MKLRCVWEHNGYDTLLYAADFPGAFARAKNLDSAVEKMPREMVSYLRWCGLSVPANFEIEIIQAKSSDLQIRDADSDVLFDSEQAPLTQAEYDFLKGLALKSAGDFLALYHAIEDKDHSCLPRRATFYGQVPRTAREMYEHTKNVNAYYFGEIGAEADNTGDILQCRQRGFVLLEQQPDFLTLPATEGSYGEYWSLRKVLRRFLWHDRIHAKAMYRMAKATFGATSVPDIFCFEEATSTD